MHAGLLKTRRSTVVWLMGIAVGASALYGTTAQALDKATGPVVLTIEGAITHTNQGQQAQFDMKMLEKLPQHT